MTSNKENMEFNNEHLKCMFFDELKEKIHILKEIYVFYPTFDQIIDIIYDLTQKEEVVQILNELSKYIEKGKLNVERKVKENEDRFKNLLDLMHFEDEYLSKNFLSQQKEGKDAR